MKKLLPVIMLLVLAAGCSKTKIYQENLEGEWNVYKYLLRDIDRTQLFQSMYPDYKLTFTSGGQFTEYYISGADTVNNAGQYSFSENIDKLILTHNEIYFVDTVPFTKVIEREYTIFNLTRTHAEFITDSSRLYVVKNEE